MSVGPAAASQISAGSARQSAALGRGCREGARPRARRRQRPAARACEAGGGSGEAAGRTRGPTASEEGRTSPFHLHRERPTRRKKRLAAAAPLWGRECVFLAALPPRTLRRRPSRDPALEWLRWQRPGPGLARAVGSPLSPAPRGAHRLAAPLGLSFRPTSSPPRPAPPGRTIGDLIPTAAGLVKLQPRPGRPGQSASETPSVRPRAHRPLPRARAPSVTKPEAGALAQGMCLLAPALQRRGPSPQVLLPLQLPAAWCRERNTRPDCCKQA
ncbi:PREDICTED: basic salivary proline-rich protein 3-like [Chinchilla lanigera]|uniref:basic salivary proline-rich protein 3-like n=1 Tax=Chinchilla lanigera TaxID=34839 RepID=UPI00038ED5F9|nr:PREDICTED: basic salivary proline-rich protein 3-like [Chinchilla lanigera]XP_005373151.1 PREDICTED: basic salivary proline-rich protein 3-like [Chinchilla lanigera]